MNSSYLNYIIHPSKIAANFSLEKIDLYITDIKARLVHLKKINPQDFTQDLINNINRFETILASLNLAYVIKESGVSHISPPDGMGWIANSYLTP